MKLYDCFKHWKNKNVIWVYSDPHFGDADCKLMNADWPSPDAQVKLINSAVGKNDVLIILGDVGDTEYVKKLKGYKVLVMGNHDKGASNYRKHYTIIDVRDNKELAHASNFEEIKKDSLTIKSFNPAVFPFTKIVNDNLFDEVYEGPVFIGEKILLSHEPVDIRFGVNLHGHCHNAEQSISQANEWAHVNVCSDVIGWKPVRLDKIIDGFKTESLHRLTIDSAIEKKCPVNDVNCSKRCSKN